MLYINGEWIKTEEQFNVINPSTGKIINYVSKSDKIKVIEAIRAAKESMEDWSNRTAKERYSYLNHVADILKERKDKIAIIITKEMGKPLAESKGEVSQAIDYIRWYAEEGRRIYGETIPPSVENKRLIIKRQPVGVVGAITPWNFPISMIARKLAPALAAGCTVILKPSSSTPLTAIEIIKAFHDAGAPKGIVNLLLGSAKTIVQELMDSSDVRKITFTGSTRIGKQLMRQSASTMKKISMELGGHAPFIVFEDANLDKATDGAISSKFRNAGQTCVCTNRMYVHEAVIEEFSSLLAKKIKDLKIGDGNEKCVDIGPLINSQAVEKSLEHVEDAKKKGAKIITGGNRLIDKEFKSGFFFEPTLLMNATKEMKIFNEETFGPVAPIFSFKTEKEVIEKANDSQYGLASYMYTKDGSRMIRVSEALEYGIVGVNDPLPTVEQAPFGGVKESGLGREGGHQGIKDFLEEKFISVQIEN